jgi:hypothetical protein
VIIECEILNQPRTIFVESEWTHSPDDPYAVEVDFRGHNVRWLISLDLLTDALTSPEEGLLHGSGDVLIEVGKNFTLIHLSNGRDSAALQFSSADILKFLEQTGELDSSEVISKKLDEFLDAL